MLSFARHKGRYGSPRIIADLRAEGWRVSENTVAQITRKLQLAGRAKHRRKATTPGAGRWRAPDLIGRDFAAEAIHRKWYGDGTEIVTDEGKLFLDSVLDMGSRRIVCFALSEHPDTELAYAALAMAVAVRGGRQAITGVILHTDQGSEYTAGSFRPPAPGCRSGSRWAGRLGPGQRGHRMVALDPGVRAALPRALRHQGRGPSPVAAWIDEYNRDRRHSALQMSAPIA